MPKFRPFFPDFGLIFVLTYWAKNRPKKSLSPKFVRKVYSAVLGQETLRASDEKDGNV